VDFVNFDEAKVRLGMTDEALQEAIRKGEIRAFRDGGTWKFRKEDIDARAPAAAAAKEPAPAEDAGDTLMSIDADILFAEEEEVPADSAAETWIAADTEGVFPGSAAAEPLGLEEAMTAPETEPAPLALSPETDESSLGAVLSDEELGMEEPGEEPVIAVDAESGMASVMGGGGTASDMAPSRTRIVTLVEPPSHNGQFTFMLVLATGILGLAVMALISMINNAVPEFLEGVAGGSMPVILLAVGVVVTGVAALVGYVMGKQRAQREAMGGL
jgi:excisionase family DNA binding protein